MHFTDVLFLTFMALCLLVPRFRIKSIAPIILLIACLCQIFLGGARWQMVPAYIFLVPLIFVTWRGGRRPGSGNFKARLGQILFVVGGIVCIAASAATAYLLPVFSLPQPGGSYAVGSSRLYFTDDQRVDSLNDSGGNRRLMLRAWYPASEKTGSPMPYWEPRLEIGKRLAQYGGLPSFIFSHIALVDSAAYQDAPVLTDQIKWPVLLFSHGLGDGHVAQNTHLMQDLASYGYVVLAIGHTYQSLVTSFPDSPPIGLDREYDQAHYAEIADNHALRLAYRKENDPQKKAEILRLKHSLEILMNESLERWVADQIFVINRLSELEDKPGGHFLGGHMDLERLGTLGMSFGGAVAGEVTLVDSRIKAGVNLDGYHFGSAMTGIGSTKPFMIMHATHEDNEENAFYFYAARAPAYRLEVSNTTHLSYTDVVLFGPLLQLVGINGSIEGERMLEITSNYVRAFFDTYLKEEFNPLLDGTSEDYPEVKFQFLDGSLATAN